MLQLICTLDLKTNSQRFKGNCISQDDSSTALHLLNPVVGSGDVSVALSDSVRFLLAVKKPEFDVTKLSSVS